MRRGLHHCTSCLLQIDEKRQHCCYHTTQSAGDRDGAATACCLWQRAFTEELKGIFLADIGISICF